MAADKNGLFPASFCLFSFLSKTIYRIKTVDLSGIRTRIVAVEAEQADHGPRIGIKANKWLLISRYSAWYHTKDNTPCKRVMFRGNRYLPTYIHTYIPTYIHTYIHIYLPTYLPTMPLICRLNPNSVLFLVSLPE